MGRPKTTEAVVLVVEDEPLLRLVAISLVESEGFEAVEAEGADAAIAILEQRSDIRIVFTDIQMPGSMDGLKLAKFIRTRWPPIEPILTSGRLKIAQNDLPERGLFFPKPYEHEAIAQAPHRLAA